MSGHPEAFTVNAWGANAIAFIEEQGLTREFSDWCGGWPCPVDPKMVAAAPELLEAIEAMVLNDRHTYRDCHKRALAAIAKARGQS